MAPGQDVLLADESDPQAAARESHSITLKETRRVEQDSTICMRQKLFDILQFATVAIPGC